MLQNIGFAGIALGIVSRFWPVWLALAVLLTLSFMFRRRLGLYGHLLSSGVGLSGLMIVGFWLFTALFAGLIAPFGPLEQIAVMKHALPGSVEPGSGVPFYLGGDKLARDVFSRMVYGSRIVLAIAPAATAISLMVGSLLGLPAGYFGGRIDALLSFIANLVLAFPVILLFYLLVTPGIMETPVPYAMAGFFFIFPILFLCTLFYTGYSKQKAKLFILLALTLIIGGYVYMGLVFDMDPLNLVHIEPNELNIFVAVAFASSPGVFRIVRGLTMDIKTREYINAALTRGERPWYVMLWEILPNARGPLIVDTCLRIGYTTILLGTLGFFGLGMSSESPDWGTAIKDGSQFLRLYAWPALAPAIALMSFVLGLNLLADSLREQSLRD
jgi:peptide/nickel transport system permease protein